MPTRNANSVAATRLVVPNSSATKIVAAEREVPGNTPATTCRSEEHTSELPSLMRHSYAVFCLKKKKNTHKPYTSPTHKTKHKNDNINNEQKQMITAVPDLSNQRKTIPDSNPPGYNEPSQETSHKGQCNPTSILNCIR